MTEPVTAKREQVSKKEEDKEDNTSDQEIMVSNNKTIYIEAESFKRKISGPYSWSIMHSNLVFLVTHTARTNLEHIEHIWF